MCPFPFFFLWLQSSFPRSPLKKEYKLCPLLKAYSSSVAWWKERNVHMIYVPYDFQYNCGENKRKKWLALRHCVACCFDKQAFFLQMKEMCHLFQNSRSFHHFVCPSVPAFVSPILPLKSFSRGRGLHCIFLCLSFSLLFSFCHSSLFRIQSPAFVSVPT